MPDAGARQPPGPCSWGTCILGIKVNRQTNTQMVTLDSGTCHMMRWGGGGREDLEDLVQALKDNFQKVTVTENVR